MTGTFRAFLSYSHADKKCADWLHRALEAYRIPSRLIGMDTGIGKVPARLAPIFRDRDELPAAGDLSVEIRGALAKSRFLVVIASPSAAQSRWVNEEVRQFKQVNGEARVLALIADGSPGSGDESECFPPALRRRVDAQGIISNEIAEPIAADLRPGGDGKRVAKLKLVAGLTGLPLDKLVQREQARRQRRLLAVAAGASVLAISMSVLALIAVRGQAEAERQRAEADGLVEYMLTDLRSQLEPVGRLEIFDSVGKRALAYYANQDINALDADALGRRARALHLVGEVRELRGDSEGALNAFEKAEKTTQELLARDPKNEQRIFDQSQSAYWVGYVAYQRKETESAERWFREYQRLANELVSLNPTKEEWRVEQSSALVNLGVLLHDARRDAEAIPYFRQALAIDTELSGAAPNDRERQWNKAQNHAWLADAQIGNWEFADALNERKSELELYAEILSEDSLDSRAMEGRAAALAQIANIQVIKGEYKVAVETSRTGLEVIEQLRTEDPENRRWQELTVNLMNQYTEALMMAGEWTSAKVANNRALELAETLVEADTTVLPWITSSLMPARWMKIAISFATDDAEVARHELRQFKKDFDNTSSVPRELARTSWILVLAMDALDKHRSDGLNASPVELEEIRRLQPTNPIELLVLNYVEGANTTPPWPADRVAQAKMIGYDPARLLAAIRGP